MTIPALYIQDTIHATSRLTVNAGLRWEPMFWPTDHWHRGSVFSMPNFLNDVHSKVYPNAPAGSLYYGDPGVNASFTGDNKLNVFSPRLGLAFDPKGDGKQTIRVGAALMYDSGMLYTAQRLASNPPFVNEIDLTTSNPGGFSDPWNTGYHYPGGNPFPPTASYFPQYALFVVLPQNFKPMSVAQWNVSYQRQFGSSWLASVSYIGNKTSHVWLGQETNPAVYSPSVCTEFSKGCTTSNTNQRRVLNQLDPSQGRYYGGLDYVYDGGNANYTALLVSAQQRLSHGVTFLANYTWSHCISEGDFTRDIAGPTFLNPYNLAMDRGDCNFDIRHIINASIVATSPVKGNSIWAHILGNWQLAPLLRVVSGAPLPVTTGKDTSLTGINSGDSPERPNYVAGADPYVASWGPKLQYLNPAAFLRQLSRNLWQSGTRCLAWARQRTIRSRAQPHLSDLRIVPAGSSRRSVQRDQPYQLRRSRNGHRHSRNFDERHFTQHEFVEFWPDHQRRRSEDFAIGDEIVFLIRRILRIQFFGWAGAGAPARLNRCPCSDVGFVTGDGGCAASTGDSGFR